MSQESAALRSLPSFSKTAFSQTNPQLKYKTVRQIQPKGARDDCHVSAAEECRPTLIKEPAFPNAKDIMLINGVDPDCKTSIKFKSTDFPLPFLYSGKASVSTTPKIIPSNSQQVPKPANTPTLSEQKRLKRDSDRKVEIELTVQPERKRPKREAERRAEALAKQGKH